MFWSDSPVRIPVGLGRATGRVRFISDNFDNFLIVDDLQAPYVSFDFFLVLKDHETAALDGTRGESPTTMGIVLVCRFAADALDMPGILANQEVMFCGHAQLRMYLEFRLSAAL